MKHQTPFIFCLIQFNWWSLLGLLLITNPLIIFLEKKNYWMCIYLKSGGTIGYQEGKRTTYLPKDEALGVTGAVNVAVEQFEEENDPREGLDL